MSLPGDWCGTHQQPLTVNDLTQEQRFPKLMAMLRENGVQSFCVVPLTTAHRRLGAMGFGSFSGEPIRRQRSSSCSRWRIRSLWPWTMSCNAASAQSATAAARSTNEIGYAWCWRSTTPSCRTSNCAKLLKAISGCLGRVIPHDLAWFCLYDPATHRLQAHALDFPQPSRLCRSGRSHSVGRNPGRVGVHDSAASADQKSQPHRVSRGDHEAGGRRRPEIRLRRSADLARASTGHPERRQYTCGGVQRRRCEIVQLDRRAGCARRCEFNGVSEKSHR